MLVSCDRWNGFQQLFTRNVSAGGVYVDCESQSCPSVGARVELRVGNLSLKGRVAHVRTPIVKASGVGAGFGVAFSSRQPFWWTLAGLSGAFPVVAEKAVSENQRRTAENLYNVGMRYLQAKNYVSAKQKFEQAFQANEELRYLAMQIVCGGYQSLALGLWEKAKETFARALEIAPSCREASIGLENLARNRPRSKK